MDTQPQQSKVVRVGYAVVSAIFFVTIVGATAFGVLTVLGTVGGNGTVSTTIVVPSDNLAGLPTNAHLASEVPVNVEIDRPTLSDGLLAIGIGLPSIVLALIILGFLRGIVRSVRDGDPFVPANVRRLRVIAFSLIAGGVVVPIASQLFAHALAESGSVNAGSFQFAIPGALPIVGLGVLVLAEVFAHGVRLREDVAGTI